MSDDLTEFSAEIADQVESFIIAVTEVARGDSPDRSVSMLLLEVSQLLLAGGRLGAIVDVIPEERFEPDAGPDPDIDDLRVGLARLLEPIDIYTEVFDPYDPAVEQVICSLSDDIADVVADLAHGLQHYRAGRPIEALWWWQFSYLSNWGSTASSALRALQAVVAHARLDASEKDQDDGPEPGRENGHEDGRGRLATASAPGEATGGGA
ncbi:MAG: DUF5063 domain-containing protein [Streptomycetales bacterium]